MMEFFLWLSGGSPLALFLIGIAVVVIIVIIIIFVVAFFQGREISFWPPKIGEKKKIIYSDKEKLDTNISKEQMDTIIAQVKERVKAEIGNQPALLYQPPGLHEQTLFIYGVRHELKRKLATIVLSEGGAWAGCSMADFSQFFSLAKQFNKISEGLAKEIEAFYSDTEMLLNTDVILSDEEFSRVRYLATGIISLLEPVVQVAVEKDRRYGEG